MRIILSSSTQEAVETVATIILDKLQSHPDSVIGLATGRTMEPVYAEVAKEALKHKLNVAKSFFFMLDEYVGIPVSHPSSFRSYIQQHVLAPLSIKESQVAFPPTHLVSQGTAGEHYEELIVQSGGIDIQLLGIGGNGHIGFNEPGSSKSSVTRVVQLTEETRLANSGQFADGKTPLEALSMGIKTILGAKELVLLATGKSKADAITYLLNHHDDEKCPATYLKSHPYFTLVLDPEAASKISLKI